MIIKNNPPALLTQWEKWQSYHPIPIVTGVNNVFMFPELCTLSYSMQIREERHYIKLYQQEGEGWSVTWLYVLYVCVHDLKQELWYDPKSADWRVKERQAMLCHSCRIRTLQTSIRSFSSSSVFLFTLHLHLFTDRSLLPGFSILFCK